MTYLPCSWSLDLGGTLPLPHLGQIHARPPPRTGGPPRRLPDPHHLPGEVAVEAFEPEGDQDPQILRRAVPRGQRAATTADESRLLRGEVGPAHGGLRHGEDGRAPGCKRRSAPRPRGQSHAGPPRGPHDLVVLRLPRF